MGECGWFLYPASFCLVGYVGFRRVLGGFMKWGGWVCCVSLMMHTRDIWLLYVVYNVCVYVYTQAGPVEVDVGSLLEGWVKGINGGRREGKARWKGSCDLKMGIIDY